MSYEYGSAGVAGVPAEQTEQAVSGGMTSA